MPHLIETFVYQKFQNRTFFSGCFCLISWGKISEGNRTLQCLVKLTIEPEWEARFESIPNTKVKGMISVHI
ncbi:MAG: hypothetical protein AAF298_11550 [Cyanobacteria bacterium P01_A01_bin.40]